MMGHSDALFVLGCGFELFGRRQRVLMLDDQRLGAGDSLSLWLESVRLIHSARLPSTWVTWVGT